MIKSPIILHLSDLHFGNTDRYENPEAYQIFFEKTSADLNNFKEKGIEPNIIIISGDLTQHSLPDEYQQVDTFLESLSDHTDIPRERMVIIPGNHDVNWKLCEAARLIAEAKGNEFKPPYFYKFDNYKKFYDSFFSGHYEFLPKLYQVYDFRQYGIIIVGFNSCVMESKSEHYGWIGRDQVIAACAECDVIDPSSKLLRIAVMHHNFKSQSENMSDNLRDADKIKQLLENGRFRFLVHGHRHYNDHECVRNLVTNFEQVIISTGSTGLKASSTMGLQCKYQIMKIEQNIFSLYMRIFALQRPNEFSTGKWVPDPFFVDHGILSNTFEWLNEIKAFSIPQKVLGDRKDVPLGKGKLITEICVGLMGTVKRDLVQQVLERLNSVQTSFLYNLEDNTIELEPPDLGEAHSYISLYVKSMNFIKIHNYTKYHIFILDIPIEGNWFGFWWPEKGFLTVSDWENYFAPPSVNEFIAYYIANITLHFFTQIDTHSDTRHCLKDFCREKEDIKLGMWSGQLCHECYKHIQAVIKRGEMTDKQFKSIQAILQMVRARARRFL